MMRALLYSALIFCLAAGAFCKRNTESAPRAHRGVLDLSYWNFQNKDSLYLEGEWEFYYNHHYMPVDFKSRDDRPRPRYTQIPGSWNGTMIKGRKIGGMGFATYRLRVQRLDNLPAALHMPVAHTSYRLFVNGKLLSTNGTAGTTPFDTIPQYKPHFVQLPEAQNFEIIIHVSNFSHRKGGLWKPPKLGSLPKIRRQYILKLSGEMAVLGALFIIGLYFLATYFFRRKDLSTLYFSACALLATLRVAVTGEHFLDDLFNGINWELSVKLEYLTFYLGIPAWVAYIREMFRKDFPVHFIYGVGLLSLFFAIIVITTPARIFTRTLLSYQILLLLSSVYIFFILIKAWLHKRPDSFLFLLGWCLIFAGFCNDNLHYSEFINTIILFPAFFIIFVFLQAIILSLRFARKSNITERLARNLETKIAQRTAVLFRSNKKLRMARRVAEEANQTNSLFLANMGHEIRTPLNRLLENIEQLNQGPMEPEQNKRLGIIMRTGARLLSIVNNITELSSIEASQPTQGRQELSLQSFLNETLSLTADWAAENHLTQTLEIRDDVPRFININVKRLRQVLLVLLNNIMSSASGGEIKLVVSLNSRTLLRESLAFSIHSSNSSLSPEKKTMISRILSRSDPIEDGTGLGLLLSRRLVEFMGGTLSFENVSDTQNSFQFTVLLTPEIDSDEFSPPGQTSLAPPTTETKQETEKPLSISILMADDKADNQELAAIFLEDTPHNLEMVENGRQALDLFKQNKYQLVLMDIDMPEMDGYATTREIRNWEEKQKRRPATIIALTTRAETEDVKKSLEAGCDGHIDKPFKRKSFMKVIDGYVRKLAADEPFRDSE